MIGSLIVIGLFAALALLVSMRPRSSATQQDQSAKEASETEPVEQPGRKKKFRLRADQVRPLVPNRGGAIASDRVTVDGMPVGYMYRKAPINDLDSGWCFLAGDEDDAYMDDPNRHGIYDINTIANCDPDIMRWLDEPEGSAFIREGGGLVRDPLGPPGTMH